jgi:hypothetical protein
MARIIEWCFAGIFLVRSLARAHIGSPVSSVFSKRVPEVVVPVRVAEAGPAEWRTWAPKRPHFAW